MVDGRRVTIDTYLIIYANDDNDNGDDECIVLERNKRNKDRIHINAKENANEAFFNEYSIVKSLSRLTSE
jgi:hypothetical protein